MKIAGIILAAGFSRRMGKNKYHLLLGGWELYQYGADLLERLPLAKRLIVTNDAEIARYCIGKGIHPVSNGNAAEGKASSIRAGVDAAGQVDGYFFMTADQPLVSAVSCQKILEAQEAEPEKIIQPVYGGKQGMPVCIPAVYAAALQQLKGEAGGKKLMTGENTRQVILADAKEHQDLDTWEDYERLEQWIRETVLL